MSVSHHNFQFAGDGNRGMIVQTSAGQTSVLAITPHDTFVFAPNFGQFTITNFAPATDTVEFSKTVFADIKALLAGTHDNAFGNAVMTDAAQDTITLKQVTTSNPGAPERFSFCVSRCSKETIASGNRIEGQRLKPSRTATRSSCPVRSLASRRIRCL